MIKEKKNIRISKLQSQTLTTIILRGILRCKYLLNVCTYIVRNVSHRIVFPNLFSVIRSLRFREKLPWNRIPNFLVLFINDLCRWCNPLYIKKETVEVGGSWQNLVGKRCHRKLYFMLAMIKIYRYTVV